MLSIFKRLKRPARSLGEKIVSRTDYGKISVDLSAVAKVAKRASEVEGILDTSVKIDDGEILKLHYSLTLETGNSVQSISGKLVDSVRNQILHQFGISEIEIYVRVESIKDAEKPKRRVR